MMFGGSSSWYDNINCCYSMFSVDVLNEPLPKYEVPRFDGQRLPKTKFTRCNLVRHVGVKHGDKSRRMRYPRYSARG
jgi:hypothetical protein